MRYKRIRSIIMAGVLGMLNVLFAYSQPADSLGYYLELAARNNPQINADFSLQNTQSLIRRIESNYTQATSGTRTLTINFQASYVVSRRLTLAAYFDHQVNTPLVSNAAYPTSNSNYGISVNLNLAR